MLESINTEAGDFEKYCQNRGIGGMLKVMLHKVFLENGKAYKDLFESLDVNSPQSSNEQNFEDIIKIYTNKDYGHDRDSEVMKKYKEIYRLLRSHSRKDRSGD